LAAGSFNWGVTGNPFLLPHRLKHDQYSVAADFVFERPRPEPHYNHAVIRDFYARREPTYQHIPNSAWDFITCLVSREKGSFWFFLGPVLALPLLLCNPVFNVKVFFSHGRGILTTALLVMIAGMSLALWVLYPHYHAPACCAIYAWLVLSMRRLRHYAVRGRPFGLFLTRM